MSGVVYNYGDIKSAVEGCLEEVREIYQDTEKDGELIYNIFKKWFQDVM